jgi:CXXX repeat modification system protein
VKNRKRIDGNSAQAVREPVRKRVGEVTAQERDEIRSLFERKNALLELFRSLSESNAMNDTIYERVVADLGKATTRFTEWWSAKSTQYHWENVAGWQWQIDFDDCSIYLVKP